jgi:tetratricopeptide (TPR) repeat protein
MSFFISALRRNRGAPIDVPKSPNEEESWLKKVFVIGQFENRAKQASCTLEDGRIFIFGGQTDKKEVDNSCFILEERAVKQNGTNLPQNDDQLNPSKMVTTKIKVQASDLKRKASILQGNNSTLRYYVTYPPITNPDESPPGLRSHSAVRYKDKIIIFGGKNKIFYNNTYILSTTTWEWQHVVCLEKLVPVFPPNASRGPKPSNITSSPTSTQQQQQQQQQQPKRTMTSLGLQRRRLRLPQGRCGHSAVVLGNKMIIYGGTTHLINKQTLGDIWSFDLETHQWQEIEPKGGIIPPKRHSHVAVALSDTCMLVWGGKCSSSNVNTPDDSSNGTTNSVTPPASPPISPPPSGSDTTPQEPTTSNNASESDSSDIQITPRAKRTNTILPARSREKESVYLDEKVCWLFDITTCIWSPIDCQIKDYENEVTSGEVQEAKQRCGHAGVYLQNGLVLFFGGYSGHMHLKDFVLLDLQKRVQIPVIMNRKLLPPSRKYHRMELFARGSRIMLFGGVSRKRGRLDDMYTIDAAQLSALCLFGDPKRGRKSLQQAIESARQLQQDLSEFGVEPPSRRLTSPSSGELDETDIMTKDGMWYLNRVSILLLLRQYKNALEHVDKALACLPTKSNEHDEIRSQARENRALIYFMLGRFDECHMDLLSLKTYRSEQLQLLMVNCLVALGKMIEATTFLETALTANRENQTLQSLYQRVIMYERAAEEQRAKGFKNIQYAAGVDVMLYEPQAINSVTSTTTTVTSNIASSHSVTNTITTTTTDDDDSLTLVRIVNYENHFENDGQLTFENRNAWNVVAVIGAEHKNGCTTFLQQLRLAYQCSMSPDECRKHQTAIRLECVKLFFALLRFRKLVNKYCKHNKILSISTTQFPDVSNIDEKSSNGEEILRNRIPWDDPSREEASETLLEAYERCITSSSKFNKTDPNLVFLNYLCPDPFLPSPSDDPNSCNYLYMMLDILSDRNLKKLRSTEGIDFLANDGFLQHELVHNKQLYPLLCQDNLAYFMDRLEHIMSANYEPSTNDVLRMTNRDSIHHPDKYVSQVITPREAQSPFRVTPQVRSERKKRKYSVTTSKFFGNNDSDDEDEDESLLTMKSPICTQEPTKIDDIDEEELTRRRNTLPIMFKKFPYNFINVVPNGNGELPSMEQISKDASIMLLVVSLGDLDRVKPRDSSIVGLRTDLLVDNLKINADNDSSLIAGLKMFDDICNSVDFANTAIMIVFTKYDIFLSKLRRKITLKRAFPDFVFKDAQDNQEMTTEQMAQESQRFIQQCFNQMNGKNKRKLHFHFINALSRFECCKTFKAIDELINAVETKRALDKYGLI